jgi:flavin-dependent dehydrogenase
MTTNPTYYDVAIVGGGLAGLALSIQLARLDHSVILFEKEEYPFQKVCGEYISLESWDFLLYLGVDLEKLKVPIITKLDLSAPNGRTLTHILPLGGFGISRYRLDHELARLAAAAGVTVRENTKVSDVQFGGEDFTITTGSSSIKAKVACASWGKRSNIDIKWKRAFSTAATSKLNNYIGVKYHAKGNFPSDTIALHNFRNGYCGIVKIEEDRYNICYLTTADNLQQSNGDILKMEETILSQNPRLREVFEKLDRNGGPVTISQISFDKKEQVEDHVLMIGDAAGMITPLCGNGMSMALHGSKIATIQIRSFLQGNISREKMENRYRFHWQKQFAGRLRMGRRIQRLFGKNRMTGFFIRLIRPFPALVDWMVRKTHGKAF